MHSAAFFSQIVVLAMALTSVAATKPHYSENGETVLRTTCGQPGNFCIAVQDSRVRVPVYKNQSSNLWQAPLGKAGQGAAVFVTDKTAVGNIHGNCNGEASRLSFNFTDAPNVRWEKGSLTAYWTSVPDVKIQEAGSAIQGHVGGGDTLHVMCKNGKNKKH